jgi:hypothetical protein
MLFVFASVFETSGETVLERLGGSSDCFGITLAFVGLQVHKIAVTAPVFYVPGFFIRLKCSYWNTAF